MYNLTDIIPPVAEIPTVIVPIGSGLVPTVSAIFTTANVVTPYSRRREMEEEIARDAQRMNEQIARDAEIARIHAEEELQMLINGLDRNNEVIAKHLQEYEQYEAELTIGEKIDLINDHSKILKYQAQQSKPLSKKQQREFYMSVLRSHSGWKIKHFKGMTLEEIKEKFIPVWKQIKDFVPMTSREEEEIFKRKGLRLKQGSAKNMKTSEEVSEEDLKEMMQMLVKETLSIRQAPSDKEKELWVELKRLFEPDFKEQLWIHTQALMHDPLEWRLYDTCGVHHVFTRDQEIFMLVERDYPLRRGLAIVMISNKLQANYVLREIHEGSCSMHAGPRSVVAKALRSGYYWPTMHTDARNLIRECNNCQVHRLVPRNPQKKLTPITSPWPFYQWGIDIAGPFSKGPGKVKFLIMAMDYFTKWIEARPVATIRGTQSSNRETPFSLTYGAEAVIPAEIGMPTLRTAEIDMVKNNEALGINLDLLEEKREQAAIHEARSKAKMEIYYNARVRSTSFRPGDLVYRNNETSHAEDKGKLEPKWEGPYEVTKALDRGAYRLRDRNGHTLSRTWNICNLKKCYMHEM
nr:hypothetical protein [Tanacetum cinerariifolium]